MPTDVHGIKSQPIEQWEEDGAIDRYGVHSITRVEMVPDEQFDRLIMMVGARHPRFPTMAVSRVQWSAIVAKAFRKVTYIFEGFIGVMPEPTYDLQGSLSEEPIETHEDFSTIAGTPSAPLNGAVFIDPATGQPTKKNDVGVFAEFKARSGSNANPMAGITSYVSPGALWIETRFSLNRPSSLGGLGSIDAPSGPNPNAPNGGNWMLWDISSTKRGYIYEIRTTWKSSGRGGWNETVYG